jgi:cellulose synthase/poly-beta-1,6-N-acetylglucosamine synthase-like glycosyltransferase
MAIRILDLSVEHPPEQPIDLSRYETLRVLVWNRARPIGELAIAGGATLAPQELLATVRRELGGRIDAGGDSQEGTGELPAVTVAVCTRDRAEDLESCLASLAAQRSPPDHEILVVDNAPADDRAAEVARRAGARYVREPLPGLTFARNRALREAKGELLAFVDDDARPDWGWLRSGTARLARDRTLAACSGPVFPAELETAAQLLFEAQGGFLQSLTPGVYGADPPNEESAGHWPCFAVGMFASGNMAFRVEALRELGGFDEALGAGTASGGGDDHDIFYRLVRSGRRYVYEPAFLIRHRHRRELDELVRQMESWGRGTSAFLAKCYRTDRAHRRAIARAARFVIAYHWRRLLENAPLRRTRRVPLRLIFAEIAGSVRGAFL